MRRGVRRRRREGKREGRKASRELVTTLLGGRAAEKEEGKKDLCISENGRKTSARDCESEAAYFSSVAADPTLSPLALAARTERQTDR